MHFFFLNLLLVYSQKISNSPCNLLLPFLLLALADAMILFRPQWCKQLPYSTTSCRLATTTTFSEVPGLTLVEDFLSEELQEIVWEETKGASILTQELASGSRKSRVSPVHNIPIRSEYTPVNIPLESFSFLDNDNNMNNNKMLLGDHFSSYGEGHCLTYYRGNQNIPRLGLPNDFLDRFISSYEDIIEKELLESRERRQRERPKQQQKQLDESPSPAERKKQWRLTLNYYPLATSGGDVRVGFPWHRDLHANGACSIILGLGSTGQLQFGKELPNFDLTKPPPQDHRVQDSELVEPVMTIDLKQGNILLLTGPARWHYVHRVLPSAEGEERASLVYGVW